MNMMGTTDCLPKQISRATALTKMSTSTTDENEGESFIVSIGNDRQDAKENINISLTPANSLTNTDTTITITTTNVTTVKLNSGYNATHPFGNLSNQLHCNSIVISRPTSEYQAVTYQPGKFKQYHELEAHIPHKGYFLSCPQMKAALISQEVSSGEKTCYWKGELPPRDYLNPVFSNKIFVGGVPWDITASSLYASFSKYGSCYVEWPNKELRNVHVNRGRLTLRTAGYVYMIFAKIGAVTELLQDCSREFGSAGEWYFKLTIERPNRVEIRLVQIIPWVMTDSLYCSRPNVVLEPKRTVFVGALHGMITAKQTLLMVLIKVLFAIMRDVYGDVLFVGIDTDRLKYPIGSARVTFSTESAYFRAVESRYLEIHTSKFIKRIQIDPFLDDAKCSGCLYIQGPYFCRELSCFNYFCQQCWQVRHVREGPYRDHEPMICTHKRPLQVESYMPYCSSNRCDLPIAVLKQTSKTVRSPISNRLIDLEEGRNTKPTFAEAAYLVPSFYTKFFKHLHPWSTSVSNSIHTSLNARNFPFQSIPSMHLRS
ncbi:unnamed protein product [Thelazia callipaeda]|uniref:RRM domain-containing protein n=1 Tax=Thelazia callipaeda TaxID=103827 RepID=A0A0N5D7I9_THECL|nr:unnamed protein product [Thelazia callipaeda]